MERGVVVEAGMSCTDCDGGEPETLRNVCSTSVGQLVFGEADVRGGTRQLARAERRRDKNGLQAGLPGMIAIIAAVAPGADPRWVRLKLASTAAQICIRFAVVPHRRPGRSPAYKGRAS